jgi:diadenosine tetraphosphatase ApaH/serine/threonine PP2A family protein phosphatase
VRVAVLSDIHANLAALDAVIGSFGSVDAVWHLGDVVGYGPEPDGVVERLAGIGAVGVRGNHDAAAIGGDEIEWFNPDARAAMEWTRGRINDATRDWLTALPVRHTEGQFGLVHGSPREPLWEYIVSVPVARANLAALTTDFGLFGHTHLPMVYAEHDGGVEQIEPAAGSIFSLAGRRALINPGSVGQPRDGIVTASYLVFDTDAGQCTWRRTPYDIDAVQVAMRAAGLPGRLVERLSYGL